MALVSEKEEPSKDEPPGDEPEKDVPMYKYDPDKVPETSWSGSYGGRQSENKGVMSIITMIMEDIQNEMKVARKAETEAQTAFEESMDSSTEVLEAQTATKTEKERQLAETTGKTVDAERFQGELIEDKGAQQKLKESLQSDCTWVKTYFESRREARKNEINGSWTRIFSE